MYYRYNNKNPFEGICEPPLFSQSEEVERKGGDGFIRKKIFNLFGQINLGSCSSLQSGLDLTKSLILNFAENFKKFEIIEDSVLFSNNTAFVESIEFSESLFLGIVPFQITLSCVEFVNLENQCVDQREVFSFSEEDGCLVSITHEVSCRGIAGSDDPLIAASNFIIDRSGYAGYFDPYGYTISSPILKSRVEKINKLTAEASMVENYIFDKSNASDNSLYIYSYTITSEEKDGVAYITLDGKISSGVEGDMSGMRELFKQLNLYSISNTEFKLVFSTSQDLDLAPESFSSSEDDENKEISFSIVYRALTHNDPFVIPIFSYSDNKDGTICFSADISIRSRYGCPNTRINKIQNYYDSTDWISYIKAKFLQYGYSGYLSNKPKTKSYSINYQDPEISLSITLCNDTEESCGIYISNFSYSMSFSPPIPQFSEFPSINGEGCYYIQDLGYLSRGKFSINGTCTPSKCLSLEENKSIIASRVNQIMIENFVASDIILDAANIEIDNEKTIASFSFSWNGKQEQSLDEEYVLATF